MWGILGFGRSSSVEKISKEEIPVKEEVSREKKVENLFAEYQKNSPHELKIWLKKMPKGGDLHIHMLGSIYSEKILELAIKNRLFYEPQTGLFSKEETSTNLPAEEIQKNNHLLVRFSNSISMRTSVPNDHDHFMYQCFYPIFSVANYIPSDEFVKKVREEAKRQNVQYLELMVSLVSLKLFASKFGQMNLDDSPKTKFIIELSRVQEDDSNFQDEVEAAYEMITKYPKQIVSLNIVGPEDHPVSQGHFKNQMEIIDRVWKKTPKPMTLHGGELTQALSSTEYLRDRIKLTLEKGHCKRIGHAVSIAEEEDAFEVLKKMRQERIAVEVCFSSNQRILKVEGEKHPVHLYHKYGVPIVLGSDDPAVNRQDFSEQFFMAMNDHQFPYSVIKKWVRNSLEFSFLPGESIFEKGELRPIFSGIEDDGWLESYEIQCFLQNSEKAKEQVALERALVAFEEEILKRSA